MTTALTRPKLSDLKHQLSFELTAERKKGLIRTWDNATKIAWAIVLVLERHGTRLSDEAFDQVFTAIVAGL